MRMQPLHYDTHKMKHGANSAVTVETDQDIKMCEALNIC